MAVPFGATLYESNKTETDYNYDLIGKNSEAFTVGDPITNATAGQARVAGTTDAIVGICAKTVTMTASNAGTTGARVMVPYIPVDEKTQFLMQTNSDLTGNATDGYTYYKLTANTTNTVQVDTTNSAQTTTSRVVMIRKVDPFNDGTSGTNGVGLRTAVVTFVKIPDLVAGV